MAYQFGGTKYLESDITAASLSSTPMTIACWARRNGNTSNIFLVNVGEKTSNHRNQLAITGSGGFVVSQIGSSGDNLFTTFTATDATWAHFVGVFSSLSSRTAFFNGSASTENTTSISSMNGPTHIQVAARYASSITADFSGNIADVGVWSVALSAGEIASLAKGVSCDKIRPGDLQFYAPLVRDLIDYSGSRTITNNNSATVANHPRLYR